MSCGKMQLFPQPCCGQSSLRMPLFDGKHCGCGECWSPAPMCEDCKCVRIQNPACPGEFADVELCVDCDGNLSICVRRPNRTNCGCGPHHGKCRPQCGPGPWIR
ncbi:MAG: hypothetical protein ACI4O8_01600 [Aristaeellaceae bacterium]